MFIFLTKLLIKFLYIFNKVINKVSLYIYINLLYVKVLDFVYFLKNHKLLYTIRIENFHSDWKN